MTLDLVKDDNGYGFKIDEIDMIDPNKKMLEIIYRLKNDESPDVNMTLKEINIDDVKKGLSGSNLNDILVKKDINKEFDNKFEELKSLMGFTPTIFTDKK